MFSVAIIGAGQLGSRHLQGLKLAASPLNITVMDNNEESLKVCKERYDAISSIGEKKINYTTQISDLPNLLDLVIVATGSIPRASIVKSLLTHSSVKYLVLEKVLFPVLDEYDEIGILLKKNHVQCWINCTRRMYGLYKDLKEIIDTNKPILMSNAKENWRLCCNAIHMIDIFMYLTGEKTYSIDTSGLDNSIERSKREGYIEMTGTIYLKTGSGHSLNLVSQNNYRGEVGLKILNGDNCFIIQEGDRIWFLNDEKHGFSVPFQSQLTGILADEILITGGCSLTPYELSVSYHKPFIAAMLEKYNEVIGDNNNKLLPIT